MSRFTEPSYRPLAVLWLDDSVVRMVAVPADAVTGVLASTGAEFQDGFAVFPSDHLEDACAELDRSGVLWAVDRRLVPRSWAEVMLSGLSEDLRRPVYEALRPVLRERDSEAAAVLELAWQLFGGDSAARR